MKQVIIVTLLTPFLSLLLLNGCVQKTSDYSSDKKLTETRASLGERLFNDASLSRDGIQSCASCHDSNHAFIDPRHNRSSIDATTPGAVSQGQDNKSLGDINTPSAAYAALVPDFHFDAEEGLYKGGLFFDGRATNVVEQAKQPFLNPVEMQSTKSAVVSKVEARYADAMRTLYGANIFDDTESAFHAIADSIAAFEATAQFAPFDSKFDRVLKGEAEFSAEEKLGLELFIDEEKGNCAACHTVPTADSSKIDSLFTDFTYDNLGVPKNTLVRSQNGKGQDYVDLGLYNNPQVDDPELKGAFRVSGLRNIAVTGPYMHNGVFRDLSTTVHFYNSRDVKGALNPETQAPWEAAEVPDTMNTEELGNLGLSLQEVNAIVAFMETLTDARYLHLIPAR